MALNPFKDSNLVNLQESITGFLSDRFGFILDSAREKWSFFIKKGKERITIMLIPHSEKRIVNFHVPIFAISLFALTLIITITITSLAIINHTSTIKDVTKLKRYEVNSKGPAETARWYWSKYVTHRLTSYVGIIPLRGASGSK